MNILSEILNRDVFPALGCTEPIAVGHAASLAAHQLQEPVTEIHITVDPGVYKNGFAVSIPNTNGRRGNLIAGVLGALIAKPELKMEITTPVTEEHLRQAQSLIETGKADIYCDRSRSRLYIDVTVHSARNTARVVVEGTHTHLVSLQHNGRELHNAGNDPQSDRNETLDAALMNASLAELADFAEQLQPSQIDYLRRGIDMNLSVCEKGYALKRVGYYISQLVANQQRQDSLASDCESMTAAAADARMGGLDFPVMSSGGSGNQGIVAILVPYLVGQHYGVEEVVIIRSIALSHLINSYVKCFTGELSPLCGCAIAAGVGAAVAVVYQRAGKDMEKMTLAINNLISDLGGMLCDGAKEGCALKVASATNSAIRSAHMALNNHGITKLEGFAGETAEDTIRNLGKIGDIAMSQANETMLAIMIQKSAGIEIKGHN